MTSRPGPWCARAATDATQAAACQRLARLAVLRARRSATAFVVLVHARMARPLRSDWIAWFTTLPSTTTFIACLFLPQFRDCHGREKTAFQTSTAPMMIALAFVGVLPIVWRRLPPLVASHEEVAGMIGVMVSIAFVVCFPLVGVFCRWHNGAYFTWGAAWLELVGLIAWTSSATTRKGLRARATAR
jgi:hypothetical protein